MRFNHNVVVVASSGNSGRLTAPGPRATRRTRSPPTIRACSASRPSARTARRPGFSSDNLSVQVAAPGVQVPAQGRDGRYWLVSGTSPACALTAGVVALIRSSVPGPVAGHWSGRPLPPRPATARPAATTTRSGSAPWMPRRRWPRRHACPRSAWPGRERRGPPRPGPPWLRGSADSHFGGGPAAVPPAPVSPAGPAAARAVLHSGRGLPGGDRYRGQPARHDAAAAGRWRPAVPAGHAVDHPAALRRTAGRDRAGGSPSGAAAVPAVGRAAARPPRAAA